MATYTREELVRSALLEIGALDANEAPDAADGALTDDRAQMVMEDLYEQGLLPFDIEGSIPGIYFRPLVQIVADAIALPFGRPSREEYAAKAQRAVKRLWGIRQRPYVPTVTQATYF